ncbi:MAG: hypothetical protein EPO40_32515 [Myxococcaceae bacterium]|nr:MAG: hypothetical protein EPO40_32515 [Myxococcaceae bacterium]
MNARSTDRGATWPVFFALALAACSSEPASGGPSADVAAPEAVDSGAPPGNAADVPRAALDSGTHDSSRSGAVDAIEVPTPDQGAAHDAGFATETAVIDAGTEAADAPVAPLDLGVDEPAAPVPVDSGVDVPVPVVARDVGVDVPVVRVDAGVDVPVPVVVRDVGVDVPVPVARVDVGVDVPVARVDVGVDVPVARVDVGVDVPVAPLDVGVDVPVAPRDTGPDIVAVPDLGVDVGPPPVDVGVFPMVTGVPRIDEALKASMRAVYLRGLAAGNRPAVFVKVGDSITHSDSYLADYGPTSGMTRWNFGAYAAFQPTMAYFNATLVDDRHSSFDRESLAADSGWTSTRALVGDGALLRQELSALRPSVALVMLGSGDVDVNEVSVFRANLTRVVQIILGANVIPVLSTIPRRTNSATTIMMWPFFVTAIREVAAAQGVPLQDYWTAMEPLPVNGLSEDGEHPSVYRAPGGSPESTDFSPAALAYGYNVRNLQTLATLAHVRAVIYLDGPADR